MIILKDKELKNNNFAQIKKFNGEKKYKRRPINICHN